jgi:peptidoglycan/LPS O-acetylase OafA/YrhL
MSFGQINPPGPTNEVANFRNIKSGRILQDEVMVSETARNKPLDGLRGVAAASVIFYHAFLHNSPHLLNEVLVQPIQSLTTTRDILSKIAISIANGDAAVYVFFVLSGLVLFLSLKRRPDSRPVMQIAEFTIARLFRLYPAVVVCMVFFFLIPFVFRMAGITGLPVFSVNSLLENASLYSISMHGPSQTVQIELFAIPFILAGFFIVRTFGLSGAILCFIYGVYATDGGWPVLNLPNMQNYLVSFAAGILVADPKIGVCFGRAPSFLLWIAIALLLSAKHVLGHTIPAMIILVLAAAVLVGGLYHGRLGPLHRLLLSRPILFLGRVSYSLYLLNVIVLYGLWTFTDKWNLVKGHEIETGLCVGVITLAISIPLSRAMEMWVEQPGIQLGRKVCTALHDQCRRVSSLLRRNLHDDRVLG